MSLATLGFMTPFSSHKKVRHQPTYCVGSANIDQVSFSTSWEATATRHQESRRCLCFDLHKDLVPYKQAWSWQKSMVGRRHTSVERDEDHSDMLIVLQHPPVYTLGTGSQEKYLNFDPQNAPYDIYRTERGGEVTYHGPGQLVMYPILNLRYHKMDLHWYMRSLEEVVIRVLQSTFSIKASRVDGLTGVWVGNQKVAAIGIRVSRWISFHGVAVNITTDLTPFDHIVPCGIRDRGVVSLGAFLGGSSCRTREEDSNLIDITYNSLLKEFSEVFQLSLEHRPAFDLEIAGENSSSKLK